MTQLYLRRGLLLIAATASVFGLGVLPVSAAGNITVTVNVSASDPNPLTYRWRSSDGQITDQNARSTQWTLPAGPGLHFAYVLVSNGKGGYTERRIMVNTDGLSTVQPRPPMNLIAPPADRSSAVPFRNWLGGGVASYTLGGEGRFGVTGGIKSGFKVAVPSVTPEFNLAIPDVKVTATDKSSLAQESTSTSLSGDFTLRLFAPTPIPPMPPMPRPFSDFTTNCMLPGVSSPASVPPATFDISPCFGVDASNNPIPDEVIDREANQTNRIDPLPTKTIAKRSGEEFTWVTGRVLLEDGSACGTENEFFGVKSTATVELRDGRGNTIPGSQVPTNSWGQFSIGVSSLAIPDLAATFVVALCENASAGTSTTGTDIPASSDTDKSLDIGFLPIVGVSLPVVSSMSVTPSTITAIFDDPTDPMKHPPLPSDIVPLRPAKFLAMKGLDTRLSGCLYYKAIGAVQGCDVTKQNFLVGAVSFEDWKRAVKIDQYAPPGTQQYRAVFVNRVDLNLTRDHHSVSYNSMSNPMGATAGYVCNHAGPPRDPKSLSSTQDDIDKAIDNAVAGKNLVACVAMDYTITPGVNVTPGVNDGMPFTRFLIFGPSGDLLPSVNLDGRGEKFVPGTCTVCHGGNKYAGKFPEDGTGTADLEAHFLPFDIGNFAFSKKPGWPALTKEAQQEAIYQLNQNVLKTNKNSAEMDLINGWYKAGHVQDEMFIPATIVPNDAVRRSFYMNVIARSCRTCHIAMRDEHSIRDLNFFVLGSGGLRPSILKELVCGQTDDLLRAYAMPNSQVTFDLFWRSRGTPNDQPQLVAGMPGVNECTNPKP